MKSSEIKCLNCKKKVEKFDKINFSHNTNNNNKKQKFILAYCENCILFFNLNYKNIFIDKKNSFFPSYYHNRQSFIEQKRNQKKILEIVKLNEIKKINIFDFGCGDNFFAEQLNKLFKSAKIKSTFLGYDLIKKPKFKNIILDEKLFFKKFKSTKTKILILRDVIQYLNNFKILSKYLREKNVIIYIEIPDGFYLLTKNKFEYTNTEQISYLSVYTILKLLKKYKKKSLFYHEKKIKLIFISSDKNTKLSPNTVFKMEKKYSLVKQKLKKFHKFLLSEKNAFIGAGGKALKILNEIKLNSIKNYKINIFDEDINKKNKKIINFLKPIKLYQNENFKKYDNILLGINDTNNIISILKKQKIPKKKIIYLTRK